MSSPWLRAQNDVAVCGKLVFVAMRQNAKASFHRVAYHRISHRFGNGQAQTPRRPPAGVRRIRWRAHDVVQHDIRIGHAATAFEHGDEFTVVFQPLHFV